MVCSGWNRIGDSLLSDLILAVKTLNFLERKAILGKVEEGRIAKIDSLKGN
jgi:hypothetical protein